MDKSGFFVLLFLLIGSASCLTWKNCGAANSPIRITHFNLTPDPVPVPGTARLSVTASSTATLRSLDVKFSLKRVTKVLNKWTVRIPIPCLFKIGSCTYKNTCTLLDRMQRENWGSISRAMARQMKAMLRDARVDTSCPIAPTSFRVVNREMSLPAMPRFLSMVASGNYDFKIRITDQASGREMSCIEINMNVST